MSAVASQVRRRELQEQITELRNRLSVFRQDEAYLIEHLAAADTDLNTVMVEKGVADARKGQLVRDEPWSIDYGTMRAGSMVSAHGPKLEAFEHQQAWDECARLDTAYVKASGVRTNTERSLEQCRQKIAAVEGALNAKRDELAQLERLAVV